MASTQGNNALLGSIIEAGFGSDKPPKPIYRDKALRELELGLTGAGQTTLGQLPTYLRNFRQAMGRNNPALAAATTDYGTALRGVLNRQSTPMSDLTGLGDYLFSRVQQVPNQVIDYFGNLGQVSNLARGINPGAGGSTYETITRGGLAQRAALDANRQALASLQSLFPAQQSALLARDAALQGILPAIQSGFAGTERRALAPWQAYVGGLGDLQNYAMGQSGLNMANLQGYQPRTNWANRVGDVGRAITSNIDKYLQWAQQLSSIYSGGLGGGMGGGGGMGSLGGLFGGGGGMSSNPFGSAQAQTAATAQQVGPTYFPQQPYGTTFNPYTNSSQYFWG